MKRKSISTATYLLNKESDKFFGGIKGFAYLPDYNTEIMLFVSNDKIGGAFGVENSQTFKFDLAELEIISRGTQFVANNLKTLIELSKKNMLVDDMYSED